MNFERKIRAQNTRELVRFFFLISIAKFVVIEEQALFGSRPMNLIQTR